MSLIKKRKKVKEIQYKDSYFLFGNRWFVKSEEDGVIGVRALDESVVIPEEYILSWVGINPIQLKYESIKFSYVKMNRNNYK